jgi:hypothetical protein
LNVNLFNSNLQRIISHRSTASDHQLAHQKQQKMIALKKLQMDEEEEEEEDDERFV